MLGILPLHQSELGEVADFVSVTAASLTARICPLFPALYYSV